MNFKKIINILDRTEKKKFILITTLLFISVMIELVGIGMIFPILEIFIEKESIFLKEILSYFNLSSLNLDDNNLIKFSLFLLVSIYLFKLISLTLITYLKNEFFSNLCSNLSVKLFKLYLNQDYKFFFK